MSDLLEQVQATLGDGYRVSHEIRGGSTSRLFVATETSLDRRVVVKTLRPEAADGVNAARFRREIEIAAHLQHPHIVPILSAGERDGLVYYIMPYVDGESLRTRLARSGALPIHDAIQLLRELADALVTAHRAGFVHRDIKPENILLEHGHAVLTDFGIARALEIAGSEAITSTGVAVGTPGYMSPEQASGEQLVDGRSDLYSLAVVGYEMLAGAPPFGRRSPQALMAAHFTETPQSLREVRAEVPGTVSDAIDRALAKQPEDRFQTAQEFLDALDAPSSVRLHGRSRHAMRWIVVAGLLIAASSARVGYRFFATRSSPFDANLVAVAPFTTAGPSLDEWQWRDGPVDLLSRNLDGAGVLRAVDADFVIKEWVGREYTSSAKSLATTTKAGLVVRTSAIQVGSDSIRLVATVYDAVRGRVLDDVIEYRGSLTRLGDAVDSLSLRIFNVLPQTRRANTTRLAGVGSRNPGAVKAFITGRAMSRRGLLDSAMHYFSVAIDKDSAFALAYHERGVAPWSWRETDSSMAWDVFRAAALNRGLSPRDSFIIIIDSMQSALEIGALPSHQTSRLIRGAEAAVRQYPNDPELWKQVGEAWQHRGRWYDAMRAFPQASGAFAKAALLDATALDDPHQLEHSIYSNDVESALDLIEKGLQRNDGSAPDLFLMRAMLKGEHLADTVVDSIFTSTPIEPRSGLIRRLYGVIPDSTDTAVRLYDRLLRRRDRRLMPADSAAVSGLRTGALAARGRLREAELSAIINGPLWVAESAYFLRGGDAAKALSRLDSLLLAQNGDTRGSRSIYLALLAQRRDTAAIDDMDRAARTQIRQGGTVGVLEGAFSTRALAPGYRALALGDSIRAGKLLDSAPDSLCGFNPFLPIARAQLALARRDYRRAFAAARSGLVMYTGVGPLRVRRLLLEGQAAEALGEHDIAVRAYQGVAVLWRRADPEFRPWVREAREGLARLGAAGKV